MEKLNINENTVTTNIEALFWINKIWNSKEFEIEERENKTLEVLQHLTDRIVEELT